MVMKVEIGNTGLIIIRQEFMGQMESVYIEGDDLAVIETAISAAKRVIAQRDAPPLVPAGTERGEERTFTRCCPTGRGMLESDRLNCPYLNSQLDCDSVMLGGRCAIIGKPPPSEKAGK